MIDNVDVHDLPEKDIEIIQQLVEFMRKRAKEEAKVNKEVRERIKLPTYPLGAVKGNLSRREIYEIL